MKMDYLVVGAGLFGAVFANEMKKAGKKCIVIDKRAHIAGNVYSAANPYGDVTISDEIENMANINTYYLN